MKKENMKSEDSRRKQERVAHKTNSASSSTPLRRGKGAWSNADLDIHRKLLLKLIKEEDYASAKVMATHLTDLQPGDPVAWYFRAVALLKLGDPEHAEPCLVKSMEIAEADCWDCYQMSVIRLQKGDFEGALEWCNQAIKIEPDMSLFRLQLMEIYVARQDMDAAIEIGKEYLKESSDPSEKFWMHKVLSDLYLWMSRFAEAEAETNEALKLHAENSALWLTLGHCLSRQNKIREALKAFQRATDISPNDCDILYNIGDAFLTLGQPEKAIEPLEKAVRLKHDFSLAHYDLSLAYFQLERYPDAEKSARAALSNDPDMAFQSLNLGLGATGNLGIALMNQGNMEEAEACFRRNLRLVASSYFNLGLTLFRTQRYTEALENFQRALELEPNDGEYHNLLGQTYDQLNQPVKAEESLRHAIDLAPRDAMNQYDLGVVFAKRKERKEDALTAFEQALNLAPDMAQAYYGIARLHALAKKRELALSFLKQALSKGFSDIGYIEKDKDWKGLRKDHEFVRLLAAYRHVEMPLAGEEKRDQEKDNAKDIQ